MEIDSISKFTVSQIPVQQVSQAADSAQSKVNDQAQVKAPLTDQAPVKNNSVDSAGKSQKSGDKAEEKFTRPDAEASDRMLQTAITEANKKLKESGRMLQASMHEKTKRIMVKVINTETEEVVREIPPKKTLDMFAKVLELAGILIDEKK